MRLENSSYGITVVFVLLTLIMWYPNFIFQIQIETTKIVPKKISPKALNESCIQYPKRRRKHSNLSPTKFAIKLLYKIDVVSIGSSERESLQAAQNATFGRHVHKLFLFTEEAYGTGGDKYCTRKYYLEALSYVINTYKHDFSQIDWVAIIDDDTYLNLIALSKVLLEFQDIDTTAVVLGSADKLESPEEGGGGFIFNRAALKQLLAPVHIESFNWRNIWPMKRTAGQSVIDKCIQDIYRYNWCGYHSDWPLVACVKAAHFNITLHKGLRQSNNRCRLNENISYSSKIDMFKVRESLMSIHFMTQDDMYDQFDYVFGLSHLGYRQAKSDLYDSSITSRSSSKYTCIRYPRHKRNYTYSTNYFMKIPYKFDVISIGSKTRRSLQAAQNATFGRHVRRMFFVNEETFPKCTSCPRDTGNLFSDKTPFRNDINWYCAQQRNLQALRYVINMYKHNFSEIDWVAIIDDDTYLNLIALSKSVFDAFHDIDTNSTVIGHHERGGAGFIFNRAALKQLLAPVHIESLTWKDRPTDTEINLNQPHSGQWDEVSLNETVSNHTGLWLRNEVMELSVIDLCIKKQQGGDWCGYHSDWAIGACVKAARINMTTFGEMFQKKIRCSSDTKVSLMTPENDRHWMRESLMSMHYMTPDDMHDQYEYVFGDDVARAPGRSALRGHDRSHEFISDGWGVVRRGMYAPKEKKIPEVASSKSPNYTCINYPRRKYAFSKVDVENNSINIEYKFDVVSIGSKTRKSLQAAQNATFGRHVRRMFFVNEESFPKCTSCQRDFENFFSHQKAVDADSDWYCAQQRNLQALRYVISTYKHNFSEIDWVAIIDDDTYLNLIALSKVLLEFQTLDSKAVALGITDKSESPGEGGAGFIFNRAALKQLLVPVHIESLTWKDPVVQPYSRSLREVLIKRARAPSSKTKSIKKSVSRVSINETVSNHTGLWLRNEVTELSVIDLCIKKQQGGDWCGYHSDWAIGACVKVTQINFLDLQTSFGKVLRCKSDTNVSHTLRPDYDRHWMRESLMSMHYMTPDDMHDQYEYVFGDDVARAPGRSASLERGRSDKHI